MKLLKEILLLMQKKLQNNSKLNPLDKNQDGIIDDHELEVAETETNLRKHLAQLRMARYSLIAMGVFTLAMFFVRLKIATFSSSKAGICW